MAGMAGWTGTDHLNLKLEPLIAKPCGYVIEYLLKVLP